MKSRTAPSVIAVAITAVIAAIVLSACGGDSSSSSDVTASTTTASTADASTADASTTDESSGVEEEQGGADATVTISQSRFDNAELRVAAGTTVSFVNTDPFAHTITSKEDAPVGFDSGSLEQDETFEFTFDEPGEYPYFCEIHPTMRAVVIVE